MKQEPVSGKGLKKSRAPLEIFGLLFLLLLPGLVVALFQAGGAATVLVYGALPVVMAYFRGATKSIWGILLFMVAAGTLARWLDQNPLPSAILMAVVALIIGLSARRGSTSPILWVGSILGFLIVRPPKLGDTGWQFFDGLNPILATAILLFIGGLWVRLIITALPHKIPNSTEAAPRTTLEMVPYALALTISTGLSTYFILLYAPGSFGGWLILTIFVVLQAQPGLTITKFRDRVLGNVGGGIIAFVLILVLQSLNQQRTVMQLVLAIVFFGISMFYLVPGPYWKYVLFSTPGVILLDSNVVSDQLSIDIWRVGSTLIGALLALGVGAVVRWGTHAFLAARKIIPDQSH